MAERRLTVRMRYHISGGRHDGRPWPAAEPWTIDVPPWEFADLIRAGHADPHGRAAEAAWAAMDTGPAPGELSKLDPRPAPAAEGAPETAGPEPGEAAEGVAGPEPDVAGTEPDDRAGTGDTDADQGTAEPPADDPAPGPVAPLPSSPKQAWIEWAVSQGAEPDRAAAMTKADLMSRYGGRL